MINLPKISDENLYKISIFDMSPKDSSLGGSTVINNKIRNEFENQPL